MSSKRDVVSAEVRADMRKIGNAILYITAIGGDRGWLDDSAMWSSSGEQQTIRLVDGSKVMLGSDTALMITFAPDACRISPAKG